VWLCQLRICTRRELTAFVLVKVFNGAVTINQHTAWCDYITVYYTTIEGQQCLRSYQICPQIIPVTILTFLPGRREQDHGWVTLYQKSRTGTVV
jgi:hypothetical protein